MDGVLNVLVIASVYSLSRLQPLSPSEPALSSAIKTMLAATLAVTTAALGVAVDAPKIPVLACTEAL